MVNLAIACKANPNNVVCREQLHIVINSIKKEVDKLSNEDNSFEVNNNLFIIKEKLHKLKDDNLKTLCHYN